MHSIGKPRFIMKKYLLLALAFCLLSTNAFSKGGGSIVTPAPRGFNIKFSKDGQPLAVAAGTTAGTVAASSGFTIPVVPGLTVEGVALGVISGAASAGALGAAIGGLGVVAIAAIPAIKNWMATAGTRINTDNVLEVSRANPGQTAGQYCYTSLGLPRGYTYYPNFYGYRNGPNTPGYSCIVEDIAQGTIRSDPTFNPAGTYGAATVSDVVQAVSQVAPTQEAVQALVDLNFPPAVDPVSLSVPPSVFVGNTVKINSDGSTETTEESATLTVISPDYVAVDLKKLFSKSTPSKTESRTELVSTTNPDGSVSSQTVTRTISTPAGTVTSTLTETKPDVAACGLPGSPPCKIDESGTAPYVDLKPKQTADDAVKPLSDFAKNPTAALPTLPTINWSFALPAGCTAILIPAFSPFLSSIDICQFQPMFHSIMSMVWLLGGLLGAISLFWRNTFGGM
jgi:hypothetical protein